MMTDCICSGNCNLLFEWRSKFCQKVVIPYWFSCQNNTVWPFKLSVREMLPKVSYRLE